MSVFSGFVHSRPKSSPQLLPELVTSATRNWMGCNRHQGTTQPTESVGVKLAPCNLHPFLALAFTVHQNEFRAMVPRLLPNPLNSPGQKAGTVLRYPHVRCRDAREFNDAGLAACPPPIVSLIFPDVIEVGIHSLVCQQQSNQLPPRCLCRRVMPVPLRHAKATVMLGAVHESRTAEPLPRLVSCRDAVKAVIADGGFRAHEPERRVPSAIAAFGIELVQCTGNFSEFPLELLLNRNHLCSGERA